jgi:hypothetical protein
MARMTILSLHQPLYARALRLQQLLLANISVESARRSPRARFSRTAPSTKLCLRRRESQLHKRYYPFAACLSWFFPPSFTKRPKSQSTQTPPSLTPVLKRIRAIQAPLPRRPTRNRPTKSRTPVLRTASVTAVPHRTRPSARPSTTATRTRSTSRPTSCDGSLRQQCLPWLTNRRRSPWILTGKSPPRRRRPAQLPKLPPQKQMAPTALMVTMHDLLLLRIDIPLAHRRSLQTTLPLLRTHHRPHSPPLSMPRNTRLRGTSSSRSKTTPPLSKSTRKVCAFVTRESCAALHNAPFG